MLLRPAPTEELVMVGIHVDSQADETHVFTLEAHTLFKSTFPWQQNAATGPDHAMPR
jgi:hypothetical protein